MDQNNNQQPQPQNTIVPPQAAPHMQQPMPTPTSPSRYRTFYLIMLILSTVTAVFRPLELLQYIPYLFGNSSEIRVAEPGRLMMLGIIGLLFTILYGSAHLVALVMLYMKKRSALTVKLTAYGIEVFSLIVVTLVSWFALQNASVIGDSGTQFSITGGFSALTGGFMLIAAAFSIAWAAIRATLWFLAVKDQRKADASSSQL